MVNVKNQRVKITRSGLERRLFDTNSILLIISDVNSDCGSGKSEKSVYLAIGPSAGRRSCARASGLL